MTDTPLISSISSLSQSEISSITTVTQSPTIVSEAFSSRPSAESGASKSTDTPLIIGAIAAGVLTGVILLVLAIFFWRCYFRNTRYVRPRTTSQRRKLDLDETQYQQQQDVEQDPAQSYAENVRILNWLAKNRAAEAGSYTGSSRGSSPRPYSPRSYSPRPTNPRAQYQHVPILEPALPR